MDGIILYILYLIPTLHLGEGEVRDVAGRYIEQHGRKAAAKGFLFRWQGRGLEESSVCL